jgi:hypothetical protein
MSSMTEKMSDAGSGQPLTKDAARHTPRKGERYRCESCGMEIQVTAECGCQDPNHVELRCCGHEMHKV